MSLRYATPELEQQALEQQASMYLFFARDLKQSRKLVNKKFVKKDDFLLILDTAIGLAEELADSRKAEAARLQVSRLFTKKRRGGRPRKKAEEPPEKRPRGRRRKYPPEALIRFADHIDRIKASDTGRKITDAEAITQFILGWPRYKGKSQWSIQHLLNAQKTLVSRGRKLRRERQSKTKIGEKV